MVQEMTAAATGSSGDRYPAADTDYVSRNRDGSRRLNLLVEGIHCANCIRTVESAMKGITGVSDARVNLTTQRLAVTWRNQDLDPSVFVDRLELLGYRAVPFDPQALRDERSSENAFLLRCLAVSGFAAGNIMLLSVSVWAGGFSDMDPATRGLMHWLSALIALPAIAYAGRPFFVSALTALRARRMNMDIPISVAVIVTAGVSLFETSVDGPHAYFDAAVMLLFFLLLGRYLDFRSRGAMRTTAENLAAMASQPAVVLDADGATREIPARNVLPGTIVVVSAGQRVPVDGTVLGAGTRIDSSLLTGETTPVDVGNGDAVHAGTLNIGATIQVLTQAAGEGTVLADIVRLVEGAEQGRAAYVRLADRAARLYAPLVHLLALLSLGGWWFLGGASFHESLLIAVAVLIITCPCALGLAVPAVQVAACSRLMSAGVVVKSGDALERLADADTVVLDKTGTVTMGRPEIVNKEEISPRDLRLAASLAISSSHPLCRAVVRAAGPVEVAADVTEVPGMGLVAEIEGEESRLGNREFCRVDAVPVAGASSSATELWLARPGRAPVCFSLADSLRPDAADFVAWLKAKGYAIELLSGDRESVVGEIADRLDIDDWQADARPADKLARLAALEKQGRSVFMIGDGLNDAPSLAGALVSAAPATGADISQSAADFVFQTDRIAPVSSAISVAKKSRRLVLVNFWLAGGYNLLAVPLAIAGFVTPLVAAVAMSGSSILVTLNALRLSRQKLDDCR